MYKPMPLLRRSRAGPSATTLCILAAVGLAGCGMSGGAGTFIVDPAQYSAYHCKDLVNEWNTLNKREQQLRSLMGKASEGGGGTAIGAMAYRTDYEVVLAKQKLLQQTATEKKCELVPTYQSDHSIR